MAFLWYCLIAKPNKPKKGAILFHAYDYTTYKA